jgi:hypothetical protein
MSIPSILLPLFIEVALTFGLLLWLGVRRREDLSNGTTRVSQIALREPNWSPRTLQTAYSFSNQFELPVLFYVLTVLEIITRHADFIFIVLAWIFVLSRLCQAFVHITGNNVRLRAAIYGVGAIALIIAWVIFAVRILLGLP